MTGMKIAAAKNQAGHWLVTFSHNLILVVWALVLNFCVTEYRVHHWSWMRWDLMFITGLLAFIIALSLAQTIPGRMTQTLERLSKRGVFEFTNGSLADFRSRLERRARLFGKIGAAFVALVILAAFLAAFRDFIVEAIPLTLLEFFLGGVAGYFIGQMVAYGTLGQLARSAGVRIAPKPGHIDRAAGLKPIGDYYFFQAMIVAIPCVYIAVWWFIIPLLPHYGPWRDPYLGLLGVVIVFEILSFIVPMLSFHAIMQEEKRSCQSEADELSRNLVELESRILHAAGPKDVSDLQKQLDIQREEYWEIENMPTWPVDVSTRRKFTVNNLLLFLPFFTEITRLSTLWEKFLKAVVEFLES
ncbi:MAG: hypothetical protein WCC12_18350 [Anaerolineales bacterium]